MIDKIKTSIREDYDAYRKEFENSVSSNVKIIDSVLSYIMKKKGKELRPILCILSARLCGEPSKDTYLAASLLEIMHIATLVHDDIVDDADKRRGWPTINRVWGNKLSLLIGDFMFSKSLINMVKLQSSESLELLSMTAENLSKGEILQIQQSLKKDLSEEGYLRMITDKTASLFSASCKLGALSVTDSKESHDALFSFGQNLGIAFQMKDDLFDIYGDKKKLGKPVGYDLKKNMLTLPVIHALKDKGMVERKVFVRTLKKYGRMNDLDNIKAVIADSGGIEYTEMMIERYTENAKNDIKSFPNSIYKDLMLEILNFNISRNI